MHLLPSTYLLYFSNHLLSKMLAQELFLYHGFKTCVGVQFGEYIGHIRTLAKQGDKCPKCHAINFMTKYFINRLVAPHFLGS